ncbi:MAG TPA: hypothetical protein VE957_03045 [Terriglobales bacterium]|nr:hypothetical protein [Terriglobales bacterium]
MLTLGVLVGAVGPPYRFSFGDELPIAHSTAQGMWIAYVLKYRCPAWIDQNYK